MAALGEGLFGKQISHWACGPAKRVSFYTNQPLSLAGNFSFRRKGAGLRYYVQRPKY